MLWQIRQAKRRAGVVHQEESPWANSTERQFASLLDSYVYEAALSNLVGSATAAPSADGGSTVALVDLLPGDCFNDADILASGVGLDG